MSQRVKQLLRRTVSATGLDYVVMAGLNGTWQCVMLLNRLQSYFYQCGYALKAQNFSYYDQRINYLRGPAAWAWVERGMFAYFALNQENPGAGNEVLDLCCGDGFYPALFLAPHAQRVDAVDRDPRAIATSRRRYRRANLRFHCCDILKDSFPQPPYDVVTCFASLQYFTPAQADALLAKIHGALAAEGGRFLGSVPLLPPDQPDAGAVRSFHDVETVRSLLAGHFREVEVRVYRAGAWPYAYFTARN